jgi:shikimate kinase
VSPPSRAPEPPERIVLLGLMGSGKTTLGTALAASLGWPMLDSDVQLQRSTGRSAREIREVDGTEALHAAEAQALLEALAERGPSVIGAAASTIENAAARTALGGPGVIALWLRGSPAVLAERFASGPHRPIYGPDPETVARNQALVRDPLFASVDPIVIEVDGHSPAEIVEAALDRVRERLREGQRPA